MLRLILILTPFFYFTLFFPPQTFSFEVSNNSIGVPGNTDMPIAGSFKDANINITSSKSGPNLRNTISFQALPNVFAAFRYSGIGDKNDYYIESGYTTWDRSFDLRVDLSKENNLRPSITVGLQDIIGTGIYTAEYLVASKTFFKKFRVTSGLGWGRFGTKNIIGNSGSRTDNVGGSSGGELRIKQLFKGDIGLFGGLEYKSPIEGLKFKTEFSSDSYKMDNSYSTVLPNSDLNLNFGLDYKLNENVSLSSFIIQNDRAGIQLNISANPKTTYEGDYLENIPQPFYSYPIPYKKITEKHWEDIIDTLKEEKIILNAYKYEKNECLVVIENNHYSTHTQAFGRTLRILSRYVPIQINKLTVILSSNGIPILSLSIDKNEVSKIVDAPNAEILSSKITKISNSPKLIGNMKVNQSLYPDNTFAIRPYANFHFFDPNRPIYYDFGLKLQNYASPKPGLIFNSLLEFPVMSTFDDVWRGTKGTLPKVRTDVKNYLNETDPKIARLTLNSYNKYSKTLYGRFTIGYLERMYAGISAEMLNYDINSNLAFGAEINYSKPRDYRQIFGFKEVSGMPEINGHISTYWDTGYYDYISQIDIGKFLAGDKGGKIKVTRSFKNGWEVGGYFTLTDVSREEFGEGSFDKGLFFSIPFNALSPFETRYVYSDHIKPISGDGGAKLDIEGRLFEILNNYSKSKIAKTWPRIWR